MAAMFNIYGSYEGRKGLAMDCRALRCLTYLFIVGTMLAFMGIVLFRNDNYWLYAFFTAVIPSSGMILMVISSKRCSSLMMTGPKETITVGVKNAIDTLQLLELEENGPVVKNSGAKGGSLIGTNRYCMSPKFQMYYGMSLYTCILLIPPVLFHFTLIVEDVNLVVLVLSLIFMPIMLLAFWLEYHTCCKRKYPSSCDILKASVVRCRWVSYIELGTMKERY